MSRLEVTPLIDEGLGNSTYLVDIGDGRAVVLDPTRDLRTVRAVAKSRGLQIAFSVETHLHADFLSGSVQLASDGARVLASAAGARTFPHHGMADGDEVDVGGLTLRALATPGHTFEHLSFLLLDGAEPLGVFTGGSLLVGAAARTDLLGAEHTEELARAQYRSLRRLAELPDSTTVYPTHGAGSFCSAPPGAERTSTIGDERATNPYLSAPDEDAFVAKLLRSLGSYPPYFDRLGELNRVGPSLINDTSLTALPPDAVAALRVSGADVIDVRPYDTYAHAHIAESLSIPLRSAFATWLGWLIPSPTTPLVIVRAPDQDPEEVIWQALKIGYENIVGELSGGLAAWTAAGYSVTSTGLEPPSSAELGELVDVRQVGEFASGHVPGATNIALGDLRTASESLDDKRVVLMCGHGERAATAASVLERAGVSGVSIFSGGPQDWADAVPGRSIKVDA